MQIIIWLIVYKEIIRLFCLRLILTGSIIKDFYKKVVKDQGFQNIIFLP